MNQSIEEFVMMYWQKIEIPKNCTLSDYNFKKKSCAKYAAREILTAIRLNKKDHPLTTIKHFSEKMYAYSTIGGKGSYVFAIAYETAEDILYKIRSNRKQFYLF